MCIFFVRIVNFSSRHWTRLIFYDYIFFSNYARKKFKSVNVRLRTLIIIFLFYLIVCTLHTHIYKKIEYAYGCNNYNY